VGQSEKGLKFFAQAKTDQIMLKWKLSHR